MPIRIQGQPPPFKKAARRMLTAREQIAKAQAEALKERAKELAPYRTGDLQRSISYGRVSNGYQVGPTAFYGRFVELGTARLPPQPYLIPAAEEIEPRFIDAMRDAAGQALE